MEPTRPHAPSGSLPILAALALLLPLPLAAQVQDVSWITADERTVHATWYGAEGGARGVIMALHQGGASGRGEYAPIIPRLNEGGWDVVAVDLREGGSRFGGVNRTAEDDDVVDYCAAEEDVLAGVSYVRAVRADIPLVLWGSSFSGALAMRAGAQRPADVSAVLAFSPASGGPLAECRGEEMTEGMLAPVLVLRPADEAELESVQRQLEVVRAQGHQTYVADPGAHGSSMLVEERVGADVEDTWAVVEEFLLDVVRR